MANSRGVYIGVENKARPVINLCISINGQWRKVTKMYLGVNNLAKLVYPVATENPNLVFTVQVGAGTVYNVHTGGYDSSHKYEWKINWGDGQITSHTPSSLYATAKSGINHTYAAAGTYTVTIAPTSGVYTDRWLTAYGFYNTVDPYMRTVENIPRIGWNFSDGSYIFNSTFRGCTGLHTVCVMPGSPVNATTGSNFMAACFRDCVSLKVLKGIPTMGTGMSNPQRYYEECFMGCTGLVNAPAIPPVLGTTGTKSMYMYYTFANCSSLQNVPAINTSSFAASQPSQGYFLAYAFENCYSLSQNLQTILPTGTVPSAAASYALYRAFNGCTALTGSAQTLINGLAANYLTGATPTSRQTFRNCSRLSDYSTIGSNWK